MLVVGEPDAAFLVKLAALEEAGMGGAANKRGESCNVKRVEWSMC